MGFPHNFHNQVNFRILAEIISSTTRYAENTRYHHQAVGYYEIRGADRSLVFVFLSFTVANTFVLKHHQIMFNIIVKTSHL